MENSVQVKHKDGRELLLDKEKVVICQLFINGKTVSYISINMPNEPNKIGIFQVLFIGETYQLLKLPNKRLRKNVKSMGVGGGFDYDHYVSEHRYFVKKKEGEMIEFKPNKKAPLLLSCFSRSDNQKDAFTKNYCTKRIMQSLQSVPRVYTKLV